MSRPARALAVVVAAIAVGACGGPPPPANADPFGSQDRPDFVVLEIQNLNFSDARLYAIRSAGGRTALGTVGGKQDRTVRIPWDFNEYLRIEINLLAGPTCTTESLDVQPGDILQLQIDSSFQRSSFCR